MLIAKWPPGYSLFLSVSMLSGIWFCSFSHQEGDKSLFPHSLSLGWPCDLLWLKEYKGCEGVPVLRSQRAFCASALPELNPVTVKRACWIMEDKRPCGSAILVTPADSQPATRLVTASAEPCSHMNRDVWHFTKELGKCKIRPQWYITKYLPGWLNQK